jgi:dolichol-phosphate mannosyltransferase
MKLSIVVPVWKEEQAIPEYLRRVVPLAGETTSDWEIIFAMDPSPDRTEEVIMECRRNDSRVKLLKFSRRFGQQMAQLAGLQYSSGDAVIVMDVDLQDPPEVIRDLVAKWREGYDVVMAQRRSRKDSFSKTFVATVGYYLIGKLADVKIPKNTGAFRLMSRRVVNELCRLKECHGFLMGMVAIVGFKQTSILFDRPARSVGDTKYGPFGGIRNGLHGLVCFSNNLLALSSFIGFAVVGFALVLGLVVAIMKLAGTRFPIDNPAIIILVLFMGGVQLITVGILGEYIGRIYDEVKRRPKFIVDRAEGFEALEATALALKKT